MTSILWNFLWRCSDHMVAPWDIIGDFNAILHESERSIGTESSHRGMRAFREVMEYCNLLDAGFEGSNLILLSQGEIYL